jgi:hypothetical protein
VHFPMDDPEPADSRTVQVLIAKCSRAATYYGDLRRKYERVAARPWLPVAPDPPEPE